MLAADLLWPHRRNAQLRNPFTTCGDASYRTQSVQLGNYAEYSGGPSTQETYAYARTLLEAATAHPGRLQGRGCGCGWVREGELVAWSRGGWCRTSGAAIPAVLAAVSGTAPSRPPPQARKPCLRIHLLLSDGRGRALIVGGGIANFTDVAATFKGIIQVGG